MNSEEQRLRSFELWPENAPVTPEELAVAGFYATGGFLEAECNWCRKRISDWQYGDQVSVRHRQAEPLCTFLINYPASGNVPLPRFPMTPAAAPPAQMTAAQLAAAVPPREPPAGYMLVEANRLATFKNWPNPNISPKSLAKAGFFYLNRSDEVKCAWCKGVIAKWEKEDNAFEEHKRFFPDCPRAQLGPLVEMASDGIRDLGIQQLTPPKKPNFCTVDARLRTYANWPIAEIQRPEALAQAGLYYQDVDDQVRCFHCNMGLRSWQKEDDPWFEHAKWYPQCQFVRLVKGAAYIQEVQQLARQIPAAGSHTTNPNPCLVMTIDEAMTTPPVLQALEIGIDGGSIRNATQRQLLTAGRPYETVEDLVKAVFGDRDDEDTSAGSEDSSSGAEGDGNAGASIVREVSRIINTIFGATDGQHLPSTSSGNAITLASTEAATDVCPMHIIPALTVAAPPSAGVDAIAPSTSLPSSASAMSSAPIEIESSPSILRRAPSPERSLSLEEENRKLKDARLCKVCLDDEVGVVFLPCGHLVTCVQCAPSVTQCPMCRTAIKGFVRTFLS